MNAVPLKQVPRGSVEVLVTDGETRAALAVSPSLARRGIPFAVLVSRPLSLAACSRSVRHALLCPSPQQEPEAFFRAVNALVVRFHTYPLIPVSDVSLALFARHSGDLTALVDALRGGESPTPEPNREN